MADNEENYVYSPDKAEVSFRNNSILYSVIWLFMVTLSLICTELVVSNINDLFVHDFIEFKADDSTEVIYSHMSGGAAGSAVKLTVTALTHKDSGVNISLHGENLSGADLNLEGKTFMLSSFNSRASETRNHYYPEKWESFTVKNGECFNLELNYILNSSETKSPEGYIFSLSAFRDGELPTVEIILD